MRQRSASRICCVTGLGFARCVAIRDFSSLGEAFSRSGRESGLGEGFFQHEDSIAPVAPVFVITF